MKHTITIPEALFERLSRLSEQEGLKPNQMADHAIRTYIENYDFDEEGDELGEDDDLEEEESEEEEGENA